MPFLLSQRLRQKLAKSERLTTRASDLGQAGSGDDVGVNRVRSGVWGLPHRRLVGQALSLFHTSLFSEENKDAIT